MRHRTWWVCAAPMLAAAAVRGWALANWLDSPFRHYGEVAGLDMRTHLREIAGFVQGGQPFSLYYLLCAPGYLLAGPDGMIFTQLLLGVATAGLVAFAALRACGNRTAGLLAGLLVGLYGPALMYELFQLKDSLYLFAAALSLALLLQAHRRHFAPGWSVVAGAGAVWPSLVRFAGVAWLGAALLWLGLAIRRRALGRRQDRRDPRAGVPAWGGRCAWPLAGAAATLVAVTAFNAVLGHRQLPFGTGPSRFYLQGAVAPKIPATPVAELAPANGSSRQWSLPDKAWALVRAVEVTNNLNYYFVREMLPPLRLMAGPLLLMPLAFAGLGLLLWQRRLGGVTAPTGFYFLSFALPLLVYVPLARYRLALLPALAVWAACGWAAVVPRPGRPAGRVPLLSGVGMIALLVVILGPRGELPLRVEDFLAYAQGLSHYSERAGERGEALARAHRLDPRSPAAGHQLAQWLMERGDFAAARAVLEPLADSPAADRRLRLSLVAARLGCRDHAGAEAVLGSLAPDGDPDYFYQFGECHRLQGRHEAAAAAFRAGLAAARDDRQREVFRRALARGAAAGR